MDDDRHVEDSASIEGIRQKYRALSPLIDERMRRQWAATEAGALGRGGVSAASSATGLARNTISAGIGELVDPVTRGHPESPLRWTCKSTARLAEELTRQHHPVSDRTVAALLREAGYSLRTNRKTREGASHPDRNDQFEHIGRQATVFHKQRQPVVSVDTKKVAGGKPLLRMVERFQKHSTCPGILIQ